MGHCQGWAQCLSLLLHAKISQVYSSTRLLSDGRTWRHMKRGGGTVPSSLPSQLWCGTVATRWLELSFRGKTVSVMSFGNPWDWMSSPWVWTITAHFQFVESLPSSRHVLRALTMQWLQTQGQGHSWEGLLQSWCTRPSMWQVVWTLHTIFRLWQKYLSLLSSQPTIKICFHCWFWRLIKFNDRACSGLYRLHICCNTVFEVSDLGSSACHSSWWPSLLFCNCIVVDAPWPLAVGRVTSTRTLLGCFPY